MASSSQPKRGRPANPKPASSQLEKTGKGVSLATPIEPYGVRTESWGSRTRYPALNRTRDYLAKLPAATDDLSAELGTDVLERMFNDPQISASCEGMICQALAKGLQARPRYSDREHPLYKAGVEAYDFISYCLDYTHDEMLQYLEIGLNETLEDILRARLKFGNCAAEVTYRVNNLGPPSIANKLVPSFITPLDPSVYGLVMDVNKRVPGLAVYTGRKLDKNGVAVLVLEDTMMRSICLPQMETPVEQLPDGWEVIPIGKFLYTWHRSKNGDIRGTSVLRPAFNPWVLTVQLYPEYLKYLRQFASPSIKGVLPENPKRRKDPATGKMIDPKEALFDALCDFANGSAIAADFGTEIEIIFSVGEGAAFVQALNLLNQEKVKAITHSVLMEAQNHQTRAASTTGQDQAYLPALRLKHSIGQMAEKQMFRRWMYFNFGPEKAMLLTPHASLSELAPEDRNARIASWASAGWEPTPSQYVEIANELEISAPTSAEIGLMLKKREAEANPPAPVAGSTGNVSSRTRDGSRQTERNRNGRT